MAQLGGVKNLYQAKILKNEESSQRLILGINDLQFSFPTNLYQDKMKVGKEVDLFIRPKEVMIIREDKPVKDSLKRNVFEGDVLDMTDKERYPLVYFQTTEGRIPFETSVPNYTFRNLNLSADKLVKIALREESLWVMS